MLFDRRTLSVWKFMALAMLGGVGIILLPRLVFGPVGPADFGTARVLQFAVPAVFAMVWAYVLSVMAFRRLDEFQQEASKFAWYWGGTLGIALSYAVYAFVSLGGLHWLAPTSFQTGAEFFRAFRLGFLLGVGSPLLGFLAVRLWWQAAKR
jgi:hypothetical protein